MATHGDELNVSFRPTGGVCYDLDPRLIAQGDFYDSLNTRPVSDKGYSSNDREIILGNSLAWQIAIPVVQNKKFRLLLDATNAGNYKFYFADANGVSLGVTANIAVTVNNITTTLATAITQITATLGGGNISISSVITSGTTLGYVLLEFTGGTSVATWNYTVSNDVAATLVSQIIIVQEPYDASMIGQWKAIGSFDMLGDLFVWWTTATQLPQSFTISAIVTNAGKVQITTTAANPILTGYLVIIQGAPTLTNANGNWIATQIDAFNFTLNGSVFGIAQPVTGTVMVYSKTLSQVGVGVKNPNALLPVSNQWNYTRLLNTTEWNLRTKHQIDTDAEENPIRKSFYFVDAFNIDRCFYYRGAYITDGALIFNNILGEYSYGTIGNATQLITETNNISLAFTSQTQSGGNVLSGNWRYAVRPVTDTLAEGEYTFLTPPVEVYQANDISGIVDIHGNAADTATGKINNFTVTNIPADVYKFIDLAGVNYTDNSFTGVVIGRYEIPAGATSITLHHTGSESGVQDLDLGTLDFRQTPYITSKNIRIINNRLVRSNLQSGTTVDLSAFFATFKYSIETKTLPSSGSVIFSTLQQGEYLIPENQYSYLGYMHNETYRFAGKAHFKSGGWTDWFFITDITIDKSTTDPRRTGGTGNSALASWHLTDNGANIVKVPYIDFHGWSPDFVLPSGSRVRDIFDQIIIGRAECIPEVLSAGLAVLGIQGANVDATVANTTQQYGFAAPAVYENPFFSGRYWSSFGGWTAGNNPTYTQLTSGGTQEVTAARTYCSLYFPDCIYKHTAITRAVGDALINYGTPEINIIPAGTTAGVIPNVPFNIVNARILSAYGEYTGFADDPAGAPTQVSVTDVQLAIRGGDVNFAGVAYSKKNPLIITFNNFPVATGTFGEVWQDEAGYSAHMQANLTNVGSPNADMGAYYVQYFRTLGVVVNGVSPKYGAFATGLYFPTGASITIDSTTPATVLAGTLKVFGGDTFVQNTYLKHSFATTPAVIQNSSSITVPVNNVGGCGGVSFYSQNRINSQMRLNNGTTFPTVFPNLVPAIWLEQYYENPLYQEGYTPKYNFNLERGFDATMERTTQAPVTIAYSNSKPDGSLVDTYRIWLANNIKNLPLAYGEISHHELWNGELVTFQQRAIMRQYFETTGILTTKENFEVVLGDGTVLQRRGSVLTTIGTKHKWSVVKGRSNGGNDTLYWSSTELGTFARLGYDGTVNLSLNHLIDSFLQNNSQWVDGFDTPADGQGISAVWNDRFKEVIITYRGKRQNIQVYGGGTTYSSGDVVFYTPAVYSTFEQTGEFYTSIQSFNTGNTPDSSPLWWQLIPHTNSAYYNEFTLVFSEIKNKFTSKVSFKSLIYLKWEKGFLTPRPISDTGRMYEHNTGTYATWYDTQIENGFDEFVINVNSEEQKTWVANRFEADVVLFRVDFTTDNQLSYLLAGEFVSRENKHDAPVKCDSTVTLANPSGLNNLRTSKLWGFYLRVKLTYQAGVYQRFYAYINKFTFRDPMNGE